MSLGDYTNCDVDANTATLSKSSLVKALKVLVYSLALENEEIMRKIDTNSFTDFTSSFVSWGSTHLINNAKALAETMELLHTVECANANVNPKREIKFVD